MNVDEALITAKRIGAKINIPNHYDMFASNSENPYLILVKAKNKSIDSCYIHEDTVEICDSVEYYSIDSAPIMPTFAIDYEGRLHPQRNIQDLP